MENKTISAPKNLRLEAADDQTQKTSPKVQPVVPVGAMEKRATRSEPPTDSYGGLNTPGRPEEPRIDYVVMSERAKPKMDTRSIWTRLKSKISSPKSDNDIIWYDDFNGAAVKYAESKGGLDDKESFGGGGKSMIALYKKGDHGEGDRKVFFGDTPTYQGDAVRTGEKFDEIYWRVYVKHPFGWTGGGPDKLSRAISFHASDWSQAIIAHVWTVGEALTLDPVSGISGSNAVTKGYNNFDNFKWLGNRPVSEFKISSAKEAGWWVSVESRAKLNTPGKKDGINQLWIDGRLATERRNLDWRGSYTAHGINAVFLETWWNNGSPVNQRRWYDEFVISTKPIGPAVCPRNPEVVKTPYRGPGEQAGWELEITDNPNGNGYVWKSVLLKSPRLVRVDTQNGEFSGALNGQAQLAPGTMYFSRVRQQSQEGTWSDWSHWHQAFLTEKEMDEKKR
ncbi:MAG: hypothetical protein Q8P24_03930 [Desulfobacterales bacterium]|nr:hypothetical protein [Desulfobacterales bacterium]